MTFAVNMLMRMMMILMRKKNILSRNHVLPATQKAKHRCWIISDRDITRLAETGALDPIVGREEEIERVSQILSRRKKEQSDSYR